MQISKVLKQLIFDSELTAEQISKETGLSTATISRYKNGKGIENIEKLLLFFTHDVSNQDMINAINSVRRTKQEIYQSFIDHQLSNNEITEAQHKFKTAVLEGKDRYLDDDMNYHDIWKQGEPEPNFLK